MKHVQQTNGYNCGSACLAMILDMTVEDVEERVLCRKVGDLLDTQPQEGVPPQISVVNYEIECVLWNRGYRALSLLAPRPAVGETWYDRVGDRLPVIDVHGRIHRHLNSGGVAMLGVPSLREAGGEHWIVANGHDLLDPCGTEGNVYAPCATTRRSIRSLSS